MRKFMSFINIENFIVWSIVGIFFNFIVAAINTFLFLELFSIKSTIKKNILMIAIYGAIRSIFFIILPFPYYIVACLVAEVAIFKIIYKEKIQKCIVLVAINYLIEVILHSLFVIIFLKLTNKGVSYIEIIYRWKYLIYLYLCTSILKMGICFFVKKKSIILDIEEGLSRKDKNILIIFSMLGSFIVYSSSVEIFSHVISMEYRVLILYLFSMIVYFYINIQQINRIIKLQENDTKIADLESYNKTLSIMYDNIRGFKHDFLNLVQALDGYAKIDDLEGIKKMTGSIISDCRGINNLEILNSSLINNPAIHSIITSKYYLAQKEGVQMNVDISVDLSVTQNFSYEISRILAILLDNAIEAAKECDEKVVNFKCVMDKKVNRKLIIIENSYKEKNIDIDRIFEKGYTAKNDTKNEHGLGLWTVRNTLNKLDNISLFTTKGEHFCQQLEIYS